MSAPTPEPVGTLAPEATRLVETYFARVHGALLVAASGECAETLEDLRAHVYEELAATPGSVADVDRVLAELGPPERLAAQCADAVEEPSSRLEYEEKGSALSGTLLGMPYELRFPTAGRVASRWWDPTDPHILVPRVFGVGWDVNFGALAVRLGLMRPDDEDVPFASVPERYLLVSVLVPLLVTVTLGVLVAVYQGPLPAQVAVHWGVTGVADRFASKGSALVLPVAMTIFGLAVVAAAWLRRRSPLARVASGALATMLCSISATAYAQTVATAYGSSDVGILLPGLAGSLVVTFALLVTLSRIGHAAEVRRDLDDSTKGSVR